MAISTRYGRLRRNGLCNGAGNVLGVLDPDGLDAHAGREVHEVECGAGDIHVLIGMLGAGFEILTPDIHIVLEDAVLAVCKHHEHDREFVVRGSPQRLDRIHRRAVARDGDHGTIRHCDLDADRAGKALADAAATAAEIIAEAAIVEGARKIEAGRDAFIDDDDIVGQPAAKFRGDARHRVRLAVPALLDARAIGFFLSRLQFGQRRHCGFARPA